LPSISNRKKFGIPNGYSFLKDVLLSHTYLIFPTFLFQKRTNSNLNTSLGHYFFLWLFLTHFSFLYPFPSLLLLLLLFCFLHFVLILLLLFLFCFLHFVLPVSSLSSTLNFSQYAEPAAVLRSSYCARYNQPVQDRVRRLYNPPQKNNISY
jgi:hypothetical protein